jgi:hypothetical protein
MSAERLELVWFEGGLGEERELIVRELIDRWAQAQEALRDKPLTIEVRRVLSRGYTGAINLLVRYIDDRNIRYRVFKVDRYADIEMELAAIALLNRSSGMFYCRSTTTGSTPVCKRRIDGVETAWALIEYDYVGELGPGNTVLELLDYFFEKIRGGYEADIYSRILAPLDAIIQELKGKVYEPFTVHAPGLIREVFASKLKHFSLDLVREIMSDGTQGLLVRELFGEAADWREVHGAISKALSSAIRYHKAALIHGDLNPSNILIYFSSDSAGGESCRAVLIDFLEMGRKRESGFTFYFWDFARLEGELFLSLLADEGIGAGLGDKGKAIGLMLDGLFGLKTSTSHANRVLDSVYDILYRLRYSYFSPAGRSTLSYTTEPVQREYFSTLLAFYVFYLKYRSNPKEGSKIPLALFVAYKLALSLNTEMDNALIAGLTRVVNDPKVLPVEEGRAGKRPPRKAGRVLAVVGGALLVAALAFFGLRAIAPSALAAAPAEASSPAATAASSAPILLFWGEGYKDPPSTWSPSVCSYKGGSGVFDTSGVERAAIKVRAAAGENEPASLALSWDNPDEGKGNAFVTYSISGEGGKPFSGLESVWESKCFSIVGKTDLEIVVKRLDGDGYIQVRVHDKYSNTTGGNESDATFLLDAFSGGFTPRHIELKKLRYDAKARNWTKDKNRAAVDKTLVKQVDIDCFGKGSILVSGIKFE